jgi:mechanosensitive ion channel-like protein
MWEQVDRILRQATSRIVDQVADFLPGVVVSLVLLLTAVLFAVVVRVLLVRVLRGLEFDRRAEQWGLAGLASWSASSSPSLALARATSWMIFFLGVLVSLTALNATIPSRLAMSVFEYVPHLLAALMILVAGGIMARLLARSALIGAVNMRIQSARLISLGVKWLVLLVAIAMALDHLGIGRSILPLAFGIVFGGVVLAAALAVGLGARDVVRRTLEQQLDESSGVDDRVDHI